jgi:hypothetical protein
MGASAWLVMRLVAPDFAALPLALIAMAPFLCGVALAFALDETGVRAFAPIGVVGALAALAAAILIRQPSAMATLFGFGSFGLIVAAAYNLAKAARWPAVLRAPGYWIVAAATAACLGFYCLYYVAVSRDLMFGDFMYRRIESIITASILDQGGVVDLIRLFVGSMKDEYSLLPPLLPGLVLAATSPSSRAWYQGAEIAFYAAPAYLALGVLARDLAGRRGRPRARAGWPVLAVAVCAAFAAYPAGMAVVARGMPDIGGLVLAVAALRLAERLARLLALPPGHDARVGALVRRVGLALALALFGMFLFRRWYAFAAVGIAAMLALEVVGLATIGRARFRWREATVAAALCGLVLFTLCAPILIDWLPDPGTHDYVTIYAAYRKTVAAQVAELLDWYGAAPLALAACCAIFLAVRPGDRRLLRLTCGATLIAAALFLRVQSPAIHHVYLLTPAVAASIGAVLVVLFERRRIGALAGLAALGAVTLTPAVSGWAPAGLAPTAGLPPPPRSDLAELARLKAWVEANAAPDRRYCVLASSYTINDAIVDELWQMDPGGLPVLERAKKIDVGMPHVDTRDGPPGDQLKDCAFMLVGDPVQTHLVSAYQQTVIVPAREMLEGSGIGANYRRTGEAFNLEKGVRLVVFDRVRPLDDGDIAALQARWLAARRSDPTAPVRTASP